MSLKNLGADDLSSAMHTFEENAISDTKIRTEILFLSCEIVIRGIKAKRWKRMIKGKSILSHESFVYIHVFKDGHLTDIIPSQTITMFTPADSGKRFL